ncbi:hypothetical protein F511_07417 [Dorcoceras hygrometricum]|uniref:Uncharacterized protein n=1 Tax=Dorcoceras hygrometricum TaxID=472368 RepID=A0A2Z7BHZ5_9LAMI|nr:hypothetical protein F511_07417 [Dorcoceras hygrometricum]
MREIVLLPDFVQIAGFVLPDFTPDSYIRLYQISDFAPFCSNLGFVSNSACTDFCCRYMGLRNIPDFWSVSCQTPLVLIFAVVIWVYEIFRISGLLCITNGLYPLEEQNLGTDQ